MLFLSKYNDYCFPKFIIADLVCLLNQSDYNHVHWTMFLWGKFQISDSSQLLVLMVFHYGAGQIVNLYRTVLLCW